MKLFVFGLIAYLSFGANAGTPEAMVILKSNCFSCHNPDKEKALDLSECKQFILDECDKCLEKTDMRQDVQRIFIHSLIKT